MKSPNSIVFRFVAFRSVAPLVICVPLTVGLTLPPSASVQNTLHDKEFANAVKLHNKGWAERDKGNDKTGEGLFREAASQLKRYRTKRFKDVKDRSSLDFLRATYHLAYMNELGNKDEDARTFYEQCLIHPLISAGEATVDQIPISELARKRLAVIGERSRSSKRSSTETYPRISIRGGSKGEKDLPARIVDFTPEF